ncbi:aminotransferase class I/II-fold pyridoxal phosphate-dependent enzyme [Actinosynnema sp. NPDC020468]|uniref:aminotransferase class I/II-fold pyridoxal phosphate-dependent enzyme n=1 Tax=Actinosynnema sp. NPDC020468 TaxID=3154488 RepID=UPI003404ACD5
MNLTTARGGHVVVERPRPGPADVSLLGDDYLGLGRHPQVLAERIDALRRGRARDPRPQLEAELAGFLAAPTAVLCRSGWDANVWLLDTVLRDAAPDLPVYLDERAHASLWCGAMSGGGRTRRFQHNDVDHLERLLADHGPGVVCVDSVYGALGDEAPLNDLVDVCERYDCALVANESHALGVHGPRGEGLVVALDLADRVAFRTATLARSFTGRAGVIASNREFARFRAPHSVFRATSPTHEVEGLRAALRVATTDDTARERLWSVAGRLHEDLRDLGCDTAPSTGPILPLHTGGEANLDEVCAILEDHGVFGSPFRPPTTPRNRTVLRLTAHAGLDDDALDRVVTACRAVVPKLQPYRA